VAQHEDRALAPVEAIDRGREPVAAFTCQELCLGIRAARPGDGALRLGLFGRCEPAIAAGPRLPVEVVQNKNEADQVEKAIKGWLVVRVTGAMIEDGRALDAVEGALAARPTGGKA